MSVKLERISRSNYTIVKIDWYKLTEEQLNNWGVKFHDLYLTKPHADIYIDDKGISDKDFF